MARGGKREGAGAKPKQLKRILVGQFCEKIYRTKLEENYRYKLNKMTENTKVLHKFAQSIPVEKRREWLSKEEGYLDYKESLKEALQKDQRILDQVNKAYDLLENGKITEDELDEKLEDLQPRRVLNVKPEIPSRKEILRVVADKFDLSEHTVDKYWKLYRKFEKSI